MSVDAEKARIKDRWTWSVTFRAAVAREFGIHQASVIADAAVTNWRALRGVA